VLQINRGVLISEVSKRSLPSKRHVLSGVRNTPIYQEIDKVLHFTPEIRR
jgi:hypothetical protein